jgi:hypothetical protein
MSTRSTFRHVNRLELAWKVLRLFGPGWVLYRLRHAAQHRLGLLKRGLPASTWESETLERWLRPGIPAGAAAYADWFRRHRSPFFFASLDPLRPLLAPYLHDARSPAEDLLAGRFPYFSHRVETIGFPPDWHRNAFTGQRADSGRHWSEVSYFGSGGIKIIWEPSRFAQAFVLARAYAATADERYPAAFWRLLEDWMARNPPQLGPNWKCGQETSFRILALCFGFHAFLDSPHTTPERIALFTRLMAVQARRVAFHIDFARSQKNNHGISEGMGLWTVGLLFPALRDAVAWRDLGRRVLEEESLRQIDDDGSYVQHSFIYQRVALDDLVWSLRLGEVCGHRLAPQVYDRVERCALHLLQMTDPLTGAAPDYGSNDGSLVLPLARAGFQDHRPAIQRALFACRRRRPCGPGPWDEGLLWFFGADALRSEPAPVPLVSCSGDVGGYCTLRGDEAWAFLRCARYRDRPAQADQLHFDLWWKGENVAADPGTYLYDGEEGWENVLAGTRVHNTVTVADRDQMRHAGRYLWLDWAQGSLRPLRRSASGRLEVWQGEHDGYRRLSVTHRRAVLRIGDRHWCIVDDLLGPVPDAELHWLLPLPAVGLDALRSRFVFQAAAGPVHLVCAASVPARSRVVYGGAVIAGSPSTSDPARDRIRGWDSPFYAHKSPAHSLVLSAGSPAGLRFCTWIGLGEPPLLEPSAAQPVWAGPGGLHISLAPIGAPEIIRSLRSGAESVAEAL